MNGEEDRANSASGVSSDEHARPLCVDLDGTLALVDTLHETAVHVAVRHPALFFLALGKLFREGKAAMKAALADAIQMDISTLPLREELVTWLRQEATRRPVWLVTASDRRVAAAVAERLGFFTGTLGSDGTHNLKGEEKAALLREKFGVREFDYVGDSAADLAVWRSARFSGVVSSSGRTERAMSAGCVVKWRFKRRGQSAVKVWRRALRVHQWVKNLLLFVPLVMAHELLNARLAVATVIGCISFSLCASSVYLLNDLSDVEADRAHATKRSRPIAAGALSVAEALGGVVVLLILSACASLFLPWPFVLCLFLYFLTTSFYTAVAKELPVLDILLLAALYTLRIFAGGMATALPVSNWGLGFSMFLFLSLACAKRVAELHSLKQQGAVRPGRRGYTVEDLEQIGRLGSAGGYISVLVLALYLQSPEVSRLYSTPPLLWFLCPVLLYWISRIWLIAGRGELHEDPILFAIGDRVSYVCGALCAMIMILAS